MATVVKGIDPAQLEAFNKQYMASPEKFTLGVEAKTTWEGHGLGNLGKIGQWRLGGQPITKPTRDFSVQLGSWKEVGDAIGVEGADDRIEPIEAALLALSSCVTEAITLNCARTAVPLEGLEVTANVDVDPGPITGAKDPSEWSNSLKFIHLNITARGNLSERDRKIVEEGARRSPVHHIFSSGKQVKATFKYDS
jgi:uncharacterized OsmC-like protein